MVTPQGATVPGNRWDTLVGVVPDPLPHVSVIVVHYEQQAQLDRTLAALTRQSYPAHLIEIIVVDDGSAVSPRVGATVTLLRQEDRGFRLAAARNLGVRHSTGSVLCFLDADTSPEPGYVEALTRLPAVAPEAVTVGRRRHADFTGLASDTDIEVAAAHHPLPEPAWLRDAYCASRNLLDADDRSYRFVIGAVIGCSRWFFDEVGGFDETFDSYGGEDWDWAYRAWLAGAILAHIPDAVAWHDGPEWAARSEVTPEVAAAKNAETLALATRIPSPGSGARAVASSRADIVVSMSMSMSVSVSVSRSLSVSAEASAAVAFAAVDGVLSALPRAHVIVPDRVAELFRADPRVVAARDAAHASAGSRFDRARISIELPRAAIVDPATFAALLTDFERDGGGTWRVLADDEHLMTIEHRRARERRRRWSREDAFPARTETLTGVVLLDEHFSLAAYLGGWLPGINST